MNILIHIPARGGSKGVPRKNLRTMLGISLVGWAVLTARRFRALLETRATIRIVVDTDDEEIAREGRAWGAEVPFLRPAELAGDQSPTAGSVLHAVGRYRESGWGVEGVILLQPTSPLRRADDVIACASPFLAGTADSVVSVIPLEHPLELAYRAGEAGLLTRVLPGPAGAVRRQDGTTAVFPSGAVYVISAALLSGSEKFIHDGATLGVELPRSRSLDIDTEADLSLAESVARGEALVERPGTPTAGRWHQVDLAALPTGLSELEKLIQSGGTQGLRVSAPQTWSPERIFDGVAACRRATGLPVLAATP